MQFFTYYGGKQNLLKHIIPLIPSHSIYVEAFFGAGSIFFNKKEVHKEVINDSNDLLINFYQVAKSNGSELQKYIDERLLTSETFYKKSIQIIKENCNYSEIEKAWGIWYNYNFSFCSMLLGSFGHSNKKRLILSITNKFKHFSVLCNRLKYVEIFCRNANDIIKIKDVRGCFIYVDPPYFNSDIDRYHCDYDENEFIELLEILSNLKYSKFMLSSYPSDILEKYTKENNWVKKEIIQTVSVNNDKDNLKQKVEVITMNYGNDNIKEQLSIII